MKRNKGPGEVAFSNIECRGSSVTVALWHDSRSSNMSTKCCPSADSIQMDGKKWCKNVGINGACLYNEQCGGLLYCEQGKGCQAKKEPGVIASSDFECDCAGDYAGEYSSSRRRVGRCSCKCT
jgi:hypothetical protein